MTTAPKIIPITIKRLSPMSTVCVSCTGAADPTVKSNSVGIMGLIRLAGGSIPQDRMIDCRGRHRGDHQFD